MGKPSSPDARSTAAQRLRRICKLADQALDRLNTTFCAQNAIEGRPSPPPAPVQTARHRKSRDGGCPAVWPAASNQTAPMCQTAEIECFEPLIHWNPAPTWNDRLVGGKTAAFQAVVPQTPKHPPSDWCCPINFRRRICSISSLLAASARSPTGISRPTCLYPAPDMSTSPTLMLVTMEQNRRSYGVACAPGLAIMPQI